MAKGMLKFNRFWKLWLVALMGVVFGWSLLYITTLEAQVVYGASIIGLMTGLGVVTWEKGFSRSTGLMHWTWLLMNAWLFQRAQAMEGSLATWAWAVVMVTTASLVVDLVQVVLWLRGKREQTVSC